MLDKTGFPLEITGDTKPMVSFRKVRKSYGALTVLDDLDLDIAEGEMVSIIGPSGSGKTTVLRMLMTLEQIDNGVIYVDGQPLTHMPKQGHLVRANERHLRTRRADIGMCFQHFNLFPHMTVLENCMEGPVPCAGPVQGGGARPLGRAVGAGRDDLEKGSAAVAALRRTAAARGDCRALAMRPKVMLFDEVTSALDPEVIGEVTNVIRKLVSEHNLTMLMVTHQMGFARDISDRVCFFYGGKIEEQGPPAELFGNPQRERTQQFLSAVREAV